MALEILSRSTTFVAGNGVHGTGRGAGSGELVKHTLIECVGSLLAARRRTGRKRRVLCRAEAAGPKHRKVRLASRKAGPKTDDNVRINLERDLCAAGQAEVPLPLRIVAASRRSRLLLYRDQSGFCTDSGVPCSPMYTASRRTVSLPSLRPRCQSLDSMKASPAFTLRMPPRSSCSVNSPSRI